MVTHSTARPVWFCDVLITENRSGKADEAGQRRVLHHIQVLADHRRQDDAQRLRDDDQSQRGSRDASPTARAASGLPWLIAHDAAADDLRDEAELLRPWPTISATTSGWKGEAPEKFEAARTGTSTRSGLPRIKLARSSAER
jgi:hypothetical protein